MRQAKKYDKAFKEQFVLRILAGETTTGEPPGDWRSLHYRLDNG